MKTSKPYFSSYAIYSVHIVGYYTKILNVIPMCSMNLFTEIILDFFNSSIL